MSGDVGIGVSAELVLVRPSLEVREEIEAVRAELLAESPHIMGASRLGDFADPADWIARCEAQTDPATVPDDWVRTDQYLLMEDGGGRILGLVSVRHTLGTPFLSELGGHIGYSVRPSERNRGYGRAQLMLALERCREIGLDKVLLVCDATNEASRRTIISCGGVYERDGVDSSRGVTVQRYWISL